MNNPFWFLSHLDLRSSLEWVIRRFPLSVGIVFILSIFWFYVVNSETNSEWIYRSIVVSIVTFFLSVWSLIFIENLPKKRYSNTIANFFPIVFGVLFYISLYNVYNPTLETITYITLTLFGFVSFVFVAPFLRSYFEKKWENIIHFYNYFISIAWVFLMTAIVGGSLFALWSIAIGSVLALFDISDLVDEWKLFANWAIVSLVLVAPLYGLIHIPTQGDFEKNKYEENRFFSFLVRFVATPFIYVYFFILYAYTFKVLMNFSEWPKGIISWMVIGFTAFGYMIYIFSKAYDSNSRMISLFRKYFSLAVLPQVCMLFYAIYLRIAQYDITMNRYFVVIFWLWLTIISLYFVFSKSRFLSFIPVSLLTIILLISVGPWSVYNLPMNRQYDRLIKNLEKANILKNGVVTPLSSPKDISKELSGDIYSGISYVCDFDNCARIKELFKKELEEALKKDEEDWKKWNTNSRDTYHGISTWSVISTVTEKIKVQTYYEGSEIENNKYIQFNTNYKWDAPYPLSLEGWYTKLVRVYGETDTLNTDAPYPYISIDPDSSKVRYHRGAGDIVSIEFTPNSDLIDSTIHTNLEQKDLTFEIRDNTIEIKVFLQNFAVKNPAYTGLGGYQYYSISGVGLVKDKK